MAPSLAAYLSGKCAGGRGIPFSPAYAQLERGILGEPVRAGMERWPRVQLEAPGAQTQAPQVVPSAKAEFQMSPISASTAMLRSASACRQSIARVSH